MESFRECTNVSSVVNYYGMAQNMTRLKHTEQNTAPHKRYYSWMTLKAYIGCVYEANNLTYPKPF